MARTAGQKIPSDRFFRTIVRAGNAVAACISLSIVLLAAIPVAGGETAGPTAGFAARITSAREFSAERPSEHLEGLTRDRRLNAILDVELAGDPAFDHAIRVSLVESLWESGRHEEAIDLLRTLEDQSLVSGVGVGWRRPQPIDFPAKADVPVDTTGGATEIKLDHDPASGNLFAVIRWGSSWGVFFSDDQGASWSESFHYTGLFHVGMKVDLAVHNSSYPGDFAYVAYSYNRLLTNSTSKALIRRFSASTGAPDHAWGNNPVLSDDTRNFKEIALLILDGGTIFYTILRDDGEILCLAGMVTNGSVPWFNQNAGISNADRGLDVADPGEDSNHISLYISYIGDDDRIKLVRRARPTGFIQSFNVVNQPQPWADKTSVAAHLDHATVAWEFLPPGNNFQGVRTANILEHGTAPGDVEITDGIAWFTESHHLRDPLVAASDNSLDNAIVYTNESSILFRKHDSYGVHWDGPVQVVNDHDFTPGLGNTFSFEWLGRDFGIAYHDSNGNVFFVMKTGLFSDGFEGGNLSAWSSSTP